MIPEAIVNTLNPSLARWEEKSPRYKKDLIIKSVAIAAILLTAVGLIACSIHFVAIPLSINILFSIGIAALSFAAALKVHRMTHPYHFNGYDSEASAAKICRKIEDLCVADKSNGINEQLSPIYFRAMGNYFPRQINEWVRYGFIDPQYGSLLISEYTSHIQQCLELTKLRSNQKDYKENGPALLKNIKSTQVKFKHILEKLIIQDLPFLPNEV